MGISSGYWAGFSVNLQIVQILCEMWRPAQCGTGHQPKSSQP